MPSLRFEQLDQTGGTIFDGESIVAEIRDLHLVQARCMPDGVPLFGTEVPVPLYWQQYAHHQDPDRNAGSHGNVVCVASSADHVSLVCEGTNASRSIRSRYEIIVRHRQSGSGYEYAFKAAMTVAQGAHWHVSPNPVHGEVEFLNLWPHLTYATDRHDRKRYHGCYVQRGESVVLVPHHHLESSDKREILLAQGDRFLWLLEDENPVVEILSNTVVTAGVCAYMWDAHFAYRACPDLRACDLREGTRFEAEFVMYSIDRTVGEAIQRQAIKGEAIDTQTTPFFVNGLNRFAETLRADASVDHDAWPWSQEIVHGSHDDVKFSIDRQRGYDDHASVRIDSSASVRARWCATTLGPAFGGPPFGDGRKYKLRAMVRCGELHGFAAIALRLHRVGKGSIFELETYEVFTSARIMQGGEEWMECMVITPPISPPPDRMHILLEHNGVGSTWFDNVLFEELT